MNRLQLAALLLAAALLPASRSQAQSVEQIEPPSWWAGMKEPRLQLMLQGSQIGSLRPRLHTPHAGVRLLPPERVASPDYLFLNLHIAATAKPGTLQIELLKPDGRVAQRLSYALQARAPGSAQRQGFGPQDAIYLLVPDRFAKAGESVSNAEMLEAEDRSQPGGRHGGNLAGLRQHLDYIAGLGFTQIWPTPLVENNSASYSYHGYAATDFYRIDPRFGRNEDYRDLVVAAGQRGLGVIQDIVLNHIGAGHRWLRQLPEPDWLNQWPTYTETHHARLSLLDPHAAASDRERFVSGWFTRGMPDLNQRNPRVARYLTQMSIWWVEYAGLSGLRTDTYSYSDRGFLADWSRRLMQEYPRLNLVGEEWSPHPAVVAYWQRGKRNHDGYASHMPSMMDFPLHGALLAGLKEDDGHDSGLTKLYEALAHDFLYPDPQRLVLFEGNHDTPRLFSAIGQDLALWKMALLYLATAPRIPQFFYGDELLLTSPAQRDDGRVRADFPGGWVGDTVNGFTGQGLSVEQQEAQALVRRLFSWRKSAPALHGGRSTHYAPMDQVYALFRQGGGQTVMLLLNKAKEPRRVDMSRFREALGSHSEGRDVLSGQTLRWGESLELPARSALLLELR